MSSYSYFKVRDSPGLAYPFCGYTTRCSSFPRIHLGEGDFSLARAALYAPALTSSAPQLLEDTAKDWASKCSLKDGKISCDDYEWNQPLLTTADGNNVGILFSNLDLMQALLVPQVKGPRSSGISKGNVGNAKSVNGALTGAISVVALVIVVTW